MAAARLRKVAGTALAAWLLALAPVARSAEPARSDEAAAPEVAPDDEGAGAAVAPDFADAGDLPPVVPRPDFVRNRPSIPDLLLRSKREGSYITGIPSIGYDAEEGLIFGGFAQWFNNGEKTDPLFRTAPYEQSIFAGIQYASEGVWRIPFRFDWPYVNGTPYRLRIDALYEKNDVKNYFGINDRSLSLISPRTGKEYVELSKYQDDLNVFVEPGEDGCPLGSERCTNSLYNKFRSREVIGIVNLERDLLGGLVRPLIGFQVRWLDVEDYTGDEVYRIDGSDSGLQLPTQLFEDCERGLLRSCTGGWENGIRIGISYDSRNFEPNPGRGINASAILTVVSKIFGSDDDYQRLTLSAAWYYDFLEDLDTDQRLILALRAVYNMTFGDVPFYGFNRISNPDYDRAAIGGYLTQRGYKIQRFSGDSGAILNADLRWFFDGGVLWGQHLKPGFHVFGDAGRSFEGTGFTFTEMKAGGGVGFLLTWNLSTIIAFDLGVSPEDTVFYMELGLPF